MTAQVDLTFYNPLTGEIQCVYSGQNPEGQKAALSEYSWIEGHYDHSTQYISEGEAVNRPEMGIVLDKLNISADGEDEILISNIPADTTIKVFNHSTGTKIETVSSGTDTFSSVESGEILLIFENFPYIPYQVIINAD